MLAICDEELGGAVRPTEWPQISQTILKHLLHRIAVTPAVDEPFGHIYLEHVFPDDVYERLLRSLPPAESYAPASKRHYGHDGNIRAVFALTQKRLATLSGSEQELWRGVAEALAAPRLKQAMFAKLAKDLVHRYGVSESQVSGLPGYARPTLYRETAGFEIPPHPDTRKKIVTMHLYLPANRSQLDLGTALYRRRMLAWPFGPWRGRFDKVKQFTFQPNSGYAFVVNNTIFRKSWHGRETLPPNAGVRNTLLNTFYEAPRDDFVGYQDAA